MNLQTSCTLVLIAAALLLTGCGPKHSYYWGDYEKSVYRMYHDEDFSPSKEINLLNGQIERANKKNMNIGPGIYAHLGYLYTLHGDTAAATQAFQSEKLAFPESAIMMNRLLEKLP